VFCIVVVYALRTAVTDRLLQTGLHLILGGAIGNLVDRLFREPAVLRGHVVDFLELPHWPIFNVADMCITTAAVMIMILAVIKNVAVTGERYVRVKREPKTRLKPDDG